jgi:hypothetical protein
MRQRASRRYGELFRVSEVDSPMIRKYKQIGLALVLLIGAVPGAATGATSGTSFATRCQAPGVLKCVSFDTSADFGPNNLFPAMDGQIHGALDTSTTASGAGSLKFTLPPSNGANAAGYWSTSLGANFGPGTTFYVQFRLRLSPEMLTPSNGGGGFKTVIFHYHGDTCGNVEITTNNGYWRGFPQMYSQCGQDNFNTTLPGGDYLLQNGADYQCHYQSPVSRTPPCGYFQSNNWMTFYYQVTIGAWGQPNSSVQAWMAYDGQPLMQFINETNHTFYENTAGDGSLYDSITLLPYDTGRSSAASTEYVWYDDLIISTQPIAAPDPSAGAVRPSPPTQLQAR